MNSIVTPKNNCLACGCLVDRAAGVDGTYVPKAGDLSVCIMCGAVAAFDIFLKIRPLFAEEIKGITKSDETMRELAKVTRVIHFVQAGRSRN